MLECLISKMDALSLRLLSCRESLNEFWIGIRIDFPTVSEMVLSIHLCVNLEHHSLY